MTAISTHVYSAFLIGTPDVELSLIGGDVSLDAGRWPHVQASVRVVADPATLDALDPRSDPRVRLVVHAVTPSGVQDRTFNLGIRDRAVSQSGAVVTLELASDEKLLADFRPLVDDVTPISYQSSLRAIVNYVLGKVIPGTALQASPAHDGDMTTYTDAENNFRDPRLVGSYIGAGCTVARDAVWPGIVDGVQHYAMWLHTPSSSDSYGYLLGPGSMNGMQVGETWIISATGRVNIAQGGTIGPRARKLVVFMDVGGYIEMQSLALPTSGVARRSLEFTIPQGCREVFIRAYHGATSGEVQWSRVRLTRKTTQPGVDDTEYFWGGKADTATYDYSWSGDPDVSVSKRRAVIDRRPELLAWRAGRSAIDFLHPLVQVHGLRLVCDEQRRWTLRDENYTAPDSLAIRYAVNLIDGNDKISRDDDTWCDAAIIRYRWRDYQGVQQERLDTFAEPGATRAVEIVKDTPWPGAGFAEYWVRRAQQRGREVSATVVSDWRAHAEQPISVVLTGAPTQVGTTQSVAFNFDDDRMTVTTRTTDTPFGAIDLLTGTIDGLTGTIDAL
ncbi:hypothetical protein QYR02_02495 [Microbacterium maritypicum]|uniref:hypothetical protein n=1 Tax=Microbacterium maritypicum TaxID=33918 RepID=UPI002671FFDB|nr:hypothetical protein [Microbacterium liquefaciens]WKT89803.1 hypothetical protein QYR02_02495 [Microbacterium liquefaciens]